jgi:hypothetical protein
MLIQFREYLNEKNEDIKNILSNSYICFNSFNQAKRVADELRKLGIDVNENFGGELDPNQIPHLFNCFVSLNFKQGIAFIPGNENLVFSMDRRRKKEYTRFSYTDFLKLLGYEIKGNLLHDPYGEEEWDLDEHIHYLMDDYDEEEDEKMDVVGLPSGTYFEMKKSEYTKMLQTYINWSEKLKCYVYRDKDEDQIKYFLKILRNRKK